MQSVHHFGGRHARAGRGYVCTGKIPLLRYENMQIENWKSGIAIALLACSLNGCAVVAVADAAVTVVATTVKVGADVVGAAANATAAGVKAITKSGDDPKK
jgi:hypothetical protein